LKNDSPLEDVEGKSNYTTVWSIDGARIHFYVIFIKLPSYCKISQRSLNHISMHFDLCSCTEIWNRMAAWLLSRVGIHSRQSSWLLHCPWC
jgi:hypothetical protein